MGVGGVRDPWVLGDVGHFLLLMGPFVIKAKPMSALVHPWGGLWLCHPNLGCSLGVPALPHNLTTQWVPWCSLGAPGAACLLPKPSGYLSSSLGWPWLCPFPPA